ncbi:MAG: O-antigen ligase family protein [Bacteroidota bacterium]|nr:O-antigen ligase family protein [Bacteroidota bacterium]
MKNSPYKAEILLGLNILMAGTMIFSRSLSLLYSALIIIYGLFRIISKKNSDGSAHNMAGYAVGIEVLFRMNSGGLGYEFGKYAVFLFLVVGLIVERRKNVTPNIFIIFLFLLIPAIFMVSSESFERSRQLVSFNLSGPVVLALSVIYFYKRKFTPVLLKNLFLSILYPIVAMSFFLYFRSGALENLQYTTESNFQASGGFGPNQVSTILGLGILVIAASYFLNISLFRIKHLNIALLLLLLVRGLATFSRGGMLAPIIGIVVCIIIMTLLDSRFKLRMNRIVYTFIIIIVVAFLGFNYVNDVSGGLLEMRFKGESQYNAEKSNMFSGREAIFEEDLQIFQENALIGVGPGMAMEKRGEIGVEAAAHIEYSRLLAEHGIFGIAAILIILFFPALTFFESKSTNDRILLILCSVFVFVTLGHAAMRIAAAGFVYGIAFLNIVRPRQ